MDREREHVGGPFYDQHKAFAMRLPGKAVSLLQGDLCGGCGIKLSNFDQDRIRAASEVVRCPSCTRILLPAELAAEAAEVADGSEGGS